MGHLVFCLIHLTQTEMLCKYVHYEGFVSLSERAAKRRTGWRGACWEDGAASVWLHWLGVGAAHACIQRIQLPWHNAVRHANWADSTVCVCSTADFNLPRLPIPRLFIFPPHLFPQKLEHQLVISSRLHMLSWMWNNGLLQHPTVRSWKVQIR